MTRYKHLGSLVIAGAIALSPLESMAKPTDHTQVTSNFGKQLRSRDIHYREPDGQLSARVSIHTKQVKDKNPKVDAKHTQYTVQVRGYMALKPGTFMDGIIHAYINSKITETIGIYKANGQEVVDVKNKIVNQLGALKDYTIVLQYTEGEKQADIKLYRDDYSPGSTPIIDGEYKVSEDVALPLIHYADSHYLRMGFDDTVLKGEHTITKTNGSKTKDAIAQKGKKKIKSAKARKRERMGYRKIEAEKWIREGDVITIKDK